MSDDTPRGKPDDSTDQIDPAEHPVSLLLYAPFRGHSGQQLILFGLILACVGLGIAGFFFHSAHHFEIEGFPVFFGLFGFVGFSFAVLSGWPLGKLLRRNEEFYEDKLKELKREGAADDN